MYNSLLVGCSGRRLAEPSLTTIRMPEGLRALLAANDLVPRDDTDASGGCCYHAFALSVLDCRDIRVSATELRKLRRLQNPAAIVQHLRSTAVAWLVAHSDALAFADMRIQDLAVAMSTHLSTWTEYLAYHRRAGSWGDACVLHALACTFDVDLGKL